VLDISGALNARFEFKIKGRSEAGYDFLKVEVSTDGSIWDWRPIKLSGIGILSWVSGTIAEWTDALVDLSAYDGRSTFYVRFAFVTDWTNNYDGWYIDDVAVTAASSSYDGTEYRFLNGTSMAAPHVSGVAALIKAENPFLSAADIKSIIAGSVDLKPALGGSLASGGRLNAFGAVTARTCFGDYNGDFDVDGDVDGSDLAVFAADFGRTDCGIPTTCPGDFNNDGDVDGLDLAIFAADFGRTDCPIVDP